MRRHACAALLLAGFALPSHARAQRTLDITSFDARFDVAGDGSVVVTERITAHFTGQWNGLYREIPIRYTMSNGTDYTIGLHILDAKDELGHELRREESREGSYLKVKAWIPDAVDATHTLILRYNVDHALRFFEEHDELYWNVTGNAWEYPIESVHASVHLPTGASNVRTAAYTGLAGATAGDARSSVLSNVAEFQTARALQLHEGLTVVVGWAPGLVSRPTEIDRVVHAAQSNAVLLMPLLTLLLMYMVWRKWGRDPKVGTVVTQYEPPDGMTPAEMGTVIDMSVDNRDIAATLVDLAVRGHIRIREVERQKLLGFSLGTEYVIERLLAPGEYAKLAEHERLMMNGLFASGESEIKLSDLHNTFYTTLAKMKTTLWKGMMDAGLFKQDPNTVRALYLMLAFALFAVMHVAGGFFTLRWGVDPTLVTFAGFASAAIVFGFGLLMPRRTIRGIQSVRSVLGFQEFLSRVDGDRMRTTIDRPELFEKYLPHAIALGVDRQWATKFDDLTIPPPTWYVGPYPGVFHPHVFVGQISHMTTSVSSTFASSPRSSSGSGFSGGSSGGGFGGGGGGGF
jgi:uncharacterized membrane protein